MSRLSCYTNCYGHFGAWTAVERIRDAGLSSIELALRGHNLGGLVIPDEVVITERTPAERVAQFRELLALHKVTVACCNIGGADPCTSDGRALLETRLRRAHEWFAVPVVVSGAGNPGTAAERATLIENLRALGEVAREFGVVVALETHKGPTQNAAAMRQLMDDLDHPHVGINFDTGNIAYYNQGVDPADELVQIVSWVRNVHLKDNRGGFEDWYFPALGQGGAVDFRRVKSILDSADYSGGFTIELEGIGGEPEPGLDARHERVVQSVKYLRSRGFDCA